MPKIKLITVVGARPQFVKAAALSPSLARIPDIEEVLVHTGQHFDADMSDIFFEEMSLPAPRFNLGIGGGTHGQNTGRMIEAIESVLLTERPHAVIVYGDTDSTLAAALATTKLGIKLAHVEAGLRSFRREMPEEINRVLTDHVSDILYTPSASAISNLIREGIERQKIVASGDVMFDVVKRFEVISRTRSVVLRRLELEPRGYHVMTLHRKENTDDAGALRRILDGLRNSQLPIIFPMHPRTAKRLAEFDIKLPSCIRPIEPLGYLDTLQMLSNSQLVLTDSGGVQKEAYFVGRPCITLRDETEWVELVEAGANVLAGSDAERIERLLRRTAWDLPVAGLYGEGRAADIIADDLFMRITQ